MNRRSSDILFLFQRDVWPFARLTPQSFTPALSFCPIRNDGIPDGPILHRNSTVGRLPPSPIFCVRGDRRTLTAPTCQRSRPNNKEGNKQTGESPSLFSSLPTHSRKRHTNKLTVLFQVKFETKKEADLSVLNFPFRYVVSCINKVNRELL